MSKAFSTFTPTTILHSQFSTSHQIPFRKLNSKRPKKQAKTSQKMKGSFPNYQFSEVQLVTFREDKIQFFVAVASHTTKPCPAETSQHDSPSEPGVSPPFDQLQDTTTCCHRCRDYLLKSLQKHKASMDSHPEVWMGKKSGKKSRFLLSLIKSFGCSFGMLNVSLE